MTPESKAAPTPANPARYNYGVVPRSIIVCLLFTATGFAQTPTTPCPANRPVDDLISEIHAQQSKRKSRNKNPLPGGICIAGWCRDTSKKTPPTVPEKIPAESTSTSASNNTDVSSSKNPVDECNNALSLALEAAHDVEVGDYSFQQKNYRAAQFRYQDAIEKKPGDPAIHVRLGRAFEQLKEVPQAIEHYKSAQTSAESKWSEEARSALARLEAKQ